MAKPATYRAIRGCYHRSFYYNAGDKYIPSTDELDESKPEIQIPEHFVADKDFSGELVEEAEIEDRNRQVFIKPTKVEDVTSPASARIHREK